MECVLLCGGSGSRVSEITQDKIPKILIPILGKPFIEYLITSLLIYGIDSFHFSTGILGDKIEEYIKHDLPANLKMHIRYIECVKEEVPLGTGGGLINTVKKGNFNDDYALILNGDTLVSSHYSIKDLHYLLDPDWSMPVVFGAPIYTLGEYGRFELENPESIFPIVSNFVEGKIGMSWVNCGWYWAPLGPLRNEIIEYCSLEKTLLPKWVQKRPVMVKVKPENYLDIGNPTAIKRTEDILRKY